MNVYTPHKNRRAKLPSPRAVQRVRERLTASQRRIAATLFDEEGRQRMHLSDVARVCGVSPQYVGQVVRSIALLAATLPDEADEADEADKEDNDKRNEARV